MSETYYWLAKPWVLRVQVVFPQGVDKADDDTVVNYISTIFINWDAYAEQSKHNYEVAKADAEAKIREEKQAEDEAQKAKEEKIQNFNLCTLFKGLVL